MSNYTPIVAYGPKDSLSPGDPNKVIHGTQMDGELQAISAAVASKLDSSSAPGLGAANSWTNINTFEASNITGNISVIGASIGPVVTEGAASTATSNQFYKGLNVAFNGTNYITGNDGASNGGVLLVSGYNPSYLDVILIPSTGGSSQSIAPGSLPLPEITITSSGFACKSTVMATGGTFPGVSGSSSHLVAASNVAYVGLINQSSPTDEKYWSLSTNSDGSISLYATNDADNASTEAFRFFRSGNTITSAQMWGPAFGGLVDATVDAGSWTSSVSGALSSGSVTMHWTKHAGQVDIWCTGITATASAGSTLTFASLPAAITPTNDKKIACGGLTNGGTNGLSGQAIVHSAGNIQVFLSVVSGSVITSGNFTNATTVGLDNGWSIHYSL